MDYQKEYIKNNTDLHGKDTLDKVRAIKAIIEKGNIQPKSMLDIGCGSGAILLSLLSYYQITNSCGVDISETMINTAKQNDSNKLVKWIQSDLSNVNFRDYDLVLAVDIIEHIENESATLEKMKMWGKFFIIKTPIENNLISKLVKSLTLGIVDSSRSTSKKYGHIHHYSEKNFIELVEKSGYIVLEKNYMHLPKRSKIFWESVRILLMPMWLISEKAYIRLNGGFVVVLLKPKP
jgi:2-polyprenyl-3-methyl-5-hydroxy-6-metoxy-1,4-benzoquinol methylase